MKYQEQNVRSRRKASKTIANRLYLLTLRHFHAGKQRNRNKATRLETGSENFDEKYVFFSFEKLLLLS